MSDGTISKNYITRKPEPKNKHLFDDAVDTIENLHPASTGTLSPLKAEVLPGEIDAFIVHNVFTREECQILVDVAETIGFTYWDVSGANRTEFRKTDTIELDVPRLQALIWSRIKPLFDERPECAKKVFSPELDEDVETDCIGTWFAKGMSPDMLFGRYTHGGHFAPHADGSTIFDLNCRSLYTCLIYLNDVLEGGETNLFSGTQCEVARQNPETHRWEGDREKIVHSLKPTAGSVAIFYHNVVHEGYSVGPGLTKYIIRNDVMFERTPRILDSEEDRRAFKMYEEARVLESESKVQEALEIFMKIRKISPGLAKLYGLS
eukprot:PhM_4_TR12769/c0_g1_i1/m.87925